MMLIYGGHASPTGAYVLYVLYGHVGGPVHQWHGMVDSGEDGLGQRKPTLPTPDPWTGPPTLPLLSSKMSAEMISEDHAGN